MIKRKTSKLKLFEEVWRNFFPKKFLQGLLAYSLRRGFFYGLVKYGKIG